ncbi:MAG TPA: SagB family peptide dehydrogenase [Ktedonobacteraceae bacterium]|nr:SagB family peptide dehydrogenase [Ktedonobacteraceae bacterium]
MSNTEIQIGRNYAEAVFARAIRPFEPAGFATNWKDQPSRFKTYRSVERFPLPIDPPSHFASFGDVVARMATPRANLRELTFDDVATMLLFTHGLLNRRIAVSWNRDDRVLSIYPQAVYGRGAASGGGLYPTEIYWVCGAGGSLLPGIYHYDSAHHALERLFEGDVTARIRAAVFNHPAAAETDQFLLLAPNFWKNSFKYNTFCYHVVTQDLGVLLYSLRMAAASFNSDFQFLSWFQDEELNRLLGFDTLVDSVFAVLPVPAAQRRKPPGVSGTNPFPLTTPLFAQASYQRSQKLLSFPLIEDTHLATLIDTEQRPEASEAFKATDDTFENSGKLIALPPPALDQLRSDVLQIFQQRRSSFGAFSSHTPLTQQELATLLHSAATARNYVSDVKRTDGLPHFTSLMAVVINVAGIERGVYAYDERQHGLRCVQEGDFSHSLQQHYFLKNYNMAEIGVMIAVVGNVDKMLAVYGNRGYRLLNAEVGMVAQSIYMAATAMSFGCGATLGFSNVGVNKILRLEGTERRSLLFLLTGHEREGSAHFDCRYV